MGIKQQTTQSYKDKVFKKYGDKVEILSEYNGGTEPIDFKYTCEIHGIIHETMNAKNVLAFQFSPCKECTKILQSKSGKGRESSPDFYYERLKNHCISKGGKLVSKNWITAKTTYEFDCGNAEHLNFFTTADCVENKKAWCPYCYGRKGDFDEELKKIVESKNGEILSKYELAQRHILVRCNTHNFTWSVTPSNLKKDRWCTICSLNYAERVVYDYFINNKYIINLQYKFQDLVSDSNEKLKFDFAVFDAEGKIRFLLEVDGEDHRYNHKNKVKLAGINRDIQKDTYCQINNINLFRLKYFKYKKEFQNYDWYYNYIDEQINQYLKEIIK